MMNEMTDSDTRLQIESFISGETQTATEHNADFRFFEFAPRKGTNSGNDFVSCLSANAYFNSYVKGWSRNPPPDPGLFARCFKAILNNLVTESNILTLFVKSLDPSYFDELAFIGKVLLKKRRKFLLLPPSSREHTYGIGGAPDLFFEWPPGEADYLVTEWFMSPQVTIEGYVSSRTVLPDIALASSLGVTPKSMRHLLSLLELAFRLWPDFNGVSVLTDKLSTEDLTRRLDNNDLRKCVLNQNSQDNGG